MASETPKVKASVETMAYYNMILTEALPHLLQQGSGRQAANFSRPRCALDMCLCS
jgi:hypothetical protein